jgi:hypothetical protein
MLPDGIQLGADERAVPRPVAEPILDASRVVAGIGQGVATDVRKHVGVDRKGEAVRGCQCA